MTNEITSEIRRMKFGRVYLSGPISGRPMANQDTFRAAESRLRAEGVKNILVPHDIFMESQEAPQEREWADYMRECVKRMMDCSHVVTLPEWDQSKGAQIEVRLARELGIPVIHIYQIVNTLYPAESLASTVSM